MKVVVIIIFALAVVGVVLVGLAWMGAVNNWDTDIRP